MPTVTIHSDQSSSSYGSVELVSLSRTILVSPKKSTVCKLPDVIFDKIISFVGSYELLQTCRVLKKSENRIYTPILGDLERRLGPLEFSKLKLNVEDAFKDHPIRQLSKIISYIGTIVKNSGRLPKNKPLTVLFSRYLKIRDVNFLKLCSRISFFADKLDVLKASGNSLAEDAEYMRKEISSGDSRIREMHKLDLSYLGLTELPSEIERFEKLKVLDLSSNHLFTLPVGIGQFVDLDVLDLAFNRLINLTGAIGRLVNLRQLAVSNNRLSSLPYQIGGLRQLRHLYARCNMLKAMPVEIGSLENLEILIADQNELTTLPPQIAQPSRLSLIDLGRNPLRSLPSYLVKKHLRRELRPDFKNKHNSKGAIQGISNSRIFFLGYSDKIANNVVIFPGSMSIQLLASVVNDSPT